MTVLTQHAPGTFCWPELLTTNQDAAKKFYGSLLGWKINDIPLGPDGVYTIFQKNNNDAAALYKLSPEQTKMGVPPNWNPYVSVTNADQAATRAKQLGGTVLMEPMDVMDKGRMAVIKDPTGAVFSVWQAKATIGVGILNETGALCWTELLTLDIAKSKTFYSELFNWKTDAMPMPQGGEYTLFKRADGTSAAGMMKMPDMLKGVPPHWLTYFQVDDAKTTVAKVNQNGGKTLFEPMTIPNVGTFAVLADPQGAAFGVLQPPR